MAADAYLKTAANYLLRAANQLRQEAKQLAGQHTRVRHDKETTINKDSMQIKARQAEAGGTADDQRRAQAINEIKDLEQEINQAKQEINVIESQLPGAIQAKNAAAENIERQAKQLESQAGAQELRQ